MINRVVLVGRITRDPEYQQTQSGISYVRFSVACDRGVKNANGERQTDFINCIAWRNQAEFLRSYVKKGYMIGVEGRIQTGNYTDGNGNTRNTFEVLCDSVQNLEPRRDQGNSNGFEPEPPYTPSQRPQNNFVDNREDTVQSSDFEVSEDDLPF